LSSEAGLVPNELKETAMPPLDAGTALRKTQDRALSLVAVLLVVAIVVVARY
jgi:hypothetical protein